MRRGGRGPCDWRGGRRGGRRTAGPGQRRAAGTGRAPVGVAAVAFRRRAGASPARSESRRSTSPRRTAHSPTRRGDRSCSDPGCDPSAALWACRCCAARSSVAPPTAWAGGRPREHSGRPARSRPAPTSRPSRTPHPRPPSPQSPNRPSPSGPGRRRHHHRAGQARRDGPAGPAHPGRVRGRQNPAAQRLTGRGRRPGSAAFGVSARVSAWRRGRPGGRCRRPGR